MSESKNSGEGTPFVEDPKKAEDMAYASKHIRDRIASTGMEGSLKELDEEAADQYETKAGLEFDLAREVANMSRDEVFDALNVAIKRRSALREEVTKKVNNGEQLSDELKQAQDEWEIRYTVLQRESQKRSAF